MSGRTVPRRLAAAFMVAQWAMQREWLEAMRPVAEQIGGRDLSAAQLREELRAALEPFRKDAVAVEWGQPVDGAPRASVRGGVAVLRIVGPMFHYADEFTDVCGCTAYDALARDVAAVRAAYRAGVVGAAVGYFDTPGGEFGGCGEAADLVRSLAAEMPTVAYASDLCCSAGFWLASAFGERVGADASMWGSLGVVSSYVDSSERDAKAGVRRFEIVSSQSPDKRANPAEDEGRARHQALVDSLADVFIDHVARNMNVPRARVLSDFGRGGVLVGQQAVAAGMIDRLGSFEGLIAELSDKYGPGSRGTPAAGGFTLSQERTMRQEPMSGSEEQPGPITADSLRQAHPQAVAELETAAAARERERIRAVLAEATTEDERAAVAPLIEDPQATAGDAARAILAAARKAGSTAGARAKAFHDAVRADEVALDAPAPNAATAGASATDAAQVLQILNAGKLPAPSPN
ncbi:MAG TPA: S49 family peptidase [Longimicrobium sp.]|jgi:ClpP class serine protease